MHAGRRHAIGAQARHLIVHQRDKRGDDDGQTIRNERRNLVAQRFARARGHHHKHVLAIQNQIDNLLLTGTKCAVAEYIVQNMRGNGLISDGLGGGGDGYDEDSFDDLIASIACESANGN